MKDLHSGEAQSGGATSNEYVYDISGVMVCLKVSAVVLTTVVM